ncbi:GAF domain-containing protein [Arthrobacter pigmenti]|uniref:GAF domain-containing protein n=1 Tax=Arthrobacter pigmenti TaxID=271432 RepID=A0A846RLU2_9MICC|nr:GAF domain-containing protein [Arthrobacter pigmenti]
MKSDLPLDELSLTMARVSNLLLTEETVDRAIVQLAAAAKAMLLGSLGAGITLIDARGRRTSAGSTDSLVRVLDNLQYEAGEGPCLTAWASGQPVIINDLGAETRWPRWTASVYAEPVRSVVSVPLIYNAEPLGALKVYAADADAFDRNAVQTLVRFAEPSAILLSHVQTSALPAKLSATLVQALSSRNAISVGKGILMERLNLDEEAATEEMIRQSRTQGVALRSVAERSSRIAR